MRVKALGNNFEGESHRYVARIGENVNGVDNDFVRKRRERRQQLDVGNLT